MSEEGYSGPQPHQDSPFQVGPAGNEVQQSGQSDGREMLRSIEGQMVKSGVRRYPASAVLVPGIEMARQERERSW